MRAEEFVSDLIPPLKTSDNGHTALRWMNEFQVKHLPIVNNESFLGLISEDDILNVNDAEEPIGTYSLSYYRPYVKASDHLFEVLKTFSELKLSLIPVVDEEENYKGIITLMDLLDQFTRISSIIENGAIIILEIPINDYVLSDIARIVEENDAKVINLFINNHRDSSKLEVLLKINIANVSEVLRSFERFKYHIKAYHHKADSNDHLKDRYNSLMRYLDT